MTAQEAGDVIPTWGRDAETLISMAALYYYTKGECNVFLMNGIVYSLNQVINIHMCTL